MTDYQNQLFPYAYNILGSVDDALDVIQDVMEKRLSGVGGALENERAYLVKSVINRAINLKNRNKRMSGEGTWLPEPVATEAADAHIKKAGDHFLFHAGAAGAPQCPGARGIHPKRGF